MSYNISEINMKEDRYCLSKAMFILNIVFKRHSKIFKYGIPVLTIVIDSAVIYNITIFLSSYYSVNAQICVVILSGQYEVHIRNFFLFLLG